MLKSKIWLLCFSLFFASSSISAESMFGVFNLFSKKRDVIFSEVKGQLLDKGKPMSGIVIQQHWSFAGNNDQMRETVTDKDGNFTFEIIDEPRKIRGPFFEIGVPQELTATIGGEEITLWGGVKHSLEDKSEYRGKDFSIVCDIANPYIKREGQEYLRSRCLHLSMIKTEDNYE